MDNTIEIRRYNHETNDMKVFFVDPNEITQFGIYLSKTYYKNGNFRDFRRVAFIYIGKKYISFSDLKMITRLKKELKGSYTTEKIPEEIYKPRPRGYTLKRGINWTYRVQKEK